MTDAPLGESAAKSGGQTKPVARRLPEYRVSGQPGFVLHSRPYGETSLVVEVFTRDHGRVALMAKGAKRPGSRLRNVLQTFQPLELAWTGRSELKVLTAAEWMGGMRPLGNAALLYGFYLNELLLKLLAREDPHQGLYDEYVDALARLADKADDASALRLFEMALLRETGVAADLSMDAENQTPIDPDTSYVVDPQRGPRPAGAMEGIPRVSGRTLLAMARGDYSDGETQRQGKQLMRYLLAFHLNGVPLQTRKILMDLRGL